MSLFHNKGATKSNKFMLFFKFSRGGGAGPANSFLDDLSSKYPLHFFVGTPLNQRGQHSQIPESDASG